MTPPLPDPTLLARSLRDLGRATPTGTDLPSAAGDALKLTFAGAPPLLLEGLPSGPYRSLTHAAAARAIARAVVPVREVHQVLDGAWVLRSEPRGRPASPKEAVRVARQVVAALSGLTQPRFGHWPGLSMFWPEAETWGEAVIARATHFAGRVDDPLAPMALAWVTARRDALDACPRFVLVHGGLSPHATRVGDDGALVEVDDWTRGHAGDPLEDHVRYVLGPEPLARAFVAGTTLADDARARLEAYCGLRALEIASSEGRAARVVQRRRGAAQQLDLLRGGWVAALFDGSPLPLPAPARPFEPLVLTLLSDLVSVPPELGDVLLGGLAAVVLAVRVAEEGRADLAGALLRRAASALEPVRRTGLRLEGVPNAGRTPSPGSDVGHRGAALRWLCTRLEAHLTLPAALRTRLDGAAARLAGVDGLYAARVVSAPPEVRHVHDAVEGCILAAALGDHRPADARAALQRATRAAAALQLTPWSGGPLDLTPSLEALARAPALSPGQWGLYPLLLALAEIGTAVVPPEVAVRWYALELR